MERVKNQAGQELRVAARLVQEEGTMWWGVFVRNFWPCLAHITTHWQTAGTPELGTKCSLWLITQVQGLWCVCARLKV